MLVDSKKMKMLRQSKNWTQQHLADVCSLSMRTIQRVEKDGVASNETVAAYAAIFDIQANEFLISIEQFDNKHRTPGQAISSKSLALVMSAGILGGFAAGVGLTLWLF